MAYVENNSTTYTLRVKGLKDITFLGRVNQKGGLTIPEEGVYEIHVRYGDRGLALLHRGMIRKDDQMVFSHEDIDAQVKRTKKYVVKMAEINKAKEETERQKLKEAMELEAVMKKMAPLSVGSAGGSSGASTSSRVEKKAPAAPAPAAANMYDVPSDESDLDFGSDDE